MSRLAQVLYAEQVLVLGLRQAKHPKADAQALGMTGAVVSNALVMFSKVKKNFGIGSPTDRLRLMILLTSMRFSHVCTRKAVRCLGRV